jgi:hypothetical protein
MADDPKKRDASDRNKVAGGQKHEVAYVAKVAKVKPSAVKAAVKAVGNDRAKVMKALKKPKK